MDINFIVFIAGFMFSCTAGMFIYNTLEDSGFNAKERLLITLPLVAGVIARIFDYCF